MSSRQVRNRRLRILGRVVGVDYLGEHPRLFAIVKDDSFKDFVLDQLQEVPELACRAMFGGYGLYQNETFFAIIFKGRLYIKTDAQSAAPYRRLGMKPFQPNRKQTLKNYYEVPLDILEDRSRLAAWARESLSVIKRSPAISGKA